MSDAYAFAQLWISLVLFVVVYIFWFKPQRAQQCRSDLRSVRDRLFDFMWKNGYDFSNPAYRETRRIINGMIRLTSSVGPVQFIVLAVRSSSNGRREWATDRMADSALRQELEAARYECLQIYLGYLYGTGLIGFVLRSVVVFAKAAFRSWSFVSTVNRWIQDRTELLLDMASEFGAAVLTPAQKHLLGSNLP